MLKLYKIIFILLLISSTGFCNVLSSIGARGASPKAGTPEYRRYLILLDDAGLIDLSAFPELTLDKLPDMEVNSIGGKKLDNFWNLRQTPIYYSDDRTNIVTYGDIRVRVEEYGSEYFDTQIDINYVTGTNSYIPTYYTSDTNTVSVNSNGYVFATEDGLVEISVGLGSETNVINVYSKHTTGSVVNTSILGDPGSLRRTNQDFSDSLVEAAGDTPDKNYFSTMDHANAVYVFNTNCWAHDLDFSGTVISTKYPGASFGNSQWNGTLITPRHIVLPKHCISNVPNVAATSPEPVGAFKRFVGRSGTVYEREVIKHYDPGGNAPAYTNFTAWGADGGDAIIGLLDSALPTNDVAVYKIFPTNYLDVLPNSFSWYDNNRYSENANQYDYITADGGPLVGVWKGFQRNVHGVEFRTIGSFSSISSNSRTNVYKASQAGDSGNAVFLPLDDEMIFLFTITTSTSGVDWTMRSNSTNIRTNIVNILAIDGESLTEYDLSGYKTYE